ncbi:polyamine ABC transporter substrate-binding protein [Entomomonas sp. E2T0]|nr:polyamine ABC transporter substrate-binding protein [Entomomonas sp. E2T0]
MMKFFKKTLLATSITIVATGMAYAADDVLHVYNWSDYIAPDTISKFEKQTGIKVVYDVFDNNEIVEAKLIAGNSGYDIVVPSNAFLAKQIKAGLYQPLDKTKLPNWKNLNPTLMKALEVNDPENKYAVPYMWGTIGIAYNVDKVKAALGDNAPTDSWDLVFNVENMKKLKSCGVAFLDSPTEMLPAAMKYLGNDPTATDTAHIKEAQELFLKIRPYVAYFHSSKNILDLANGNICVSVGYSGDLQQSKIRAKEAKNGVNIQYNIPKEGAASFFDMMAIPKDAPNPDAAHKFINFIMQPEIAAEITNYVRFPNANSAATPLVIEDIRNDPGIYPTEAVMEKIYTFPLLPLKTQRAMVSSWTKVKTSK